MSVPAPRDPFGAFVPGPRAGAAPRARGPLDGMRVAVKDLIDVAGVVTTGGNPDWAAAHVAASRHAASVLRLLRSGAAVVGKTVTDELAFSLEGANAHFGTPRNPRAADRLPGGSSSGSAVAVAAALADIGLGTDTGGSVRIPAAFCGVYGFRPTHGAISLEGVLPFAPSYDTIGWMTAHGTLLRAAGLALLGSTSNESERGPALELCWAEDLARMAQPAVATRVRDAARRLPLAGVLEAMPTPVADQAFEAYVVLQGAEIRQSLGPDIERIRPRFGATIAERFAGIDALTRQQVARWAAWRDTERQRLDRLLDGRAALVFPTAPCPALPRDAARPAIDKFYRTALCINAMAGHAGLPQVTLPAGTVDGAPVGLSVVGPRGSDVQLLALAASWPPPDDPGS